VTATFEAERLYRLLPAVYRVRDEGQGHSLKALVALIAREFEALEENIEQLYDDQFIETCADWVAPYIGDLIGYRPLHGVVPRVASPRAEVANTIGYRRRKGTAAMLEQLARDVTDWPARAVEFFERLATTQYVNHVRLHAQAPAAVRSLPRMLAAHGPFDELAHTAEMQSPETGSGRYNIPHVGIFLWRLAAMPVTGVPLTPHQGDATGTRFRLNPLGADQLLFRKPVVEDSISHIAEPANVPAPLGIRELALQLRAAQATTQVVNATQDYGEGRSFVLHRGGTAVGINRPGVGGAAAIPVLRIADLRDVFDSGGAWAGWAHEAAIAADEIAVDPERGRVLLGANTAALHALTPYIASYHRGFSREMGGGEYERATDAPGSPTVGGGVSFQPQLDAAAVGGTLLVTDSLAYAFTPTFKVNGVTAPGAPGLEVVVAAANGARPIVQANANIILQIGARGRLVLDGLVIAGGVLRLASFADNEPRELVLRHCTLVPGNALLPDGLPASPGAMSLRVAHAFARVTLEDCIVGGVRIHRDAQLDAHGSIIDACAPEDVAIEGLAAGTPAAQLSLDECTVVGKVRTRLMCRVSNTLFFARLAARDSWLAPVRADRLQDGCVRFSFVPDGSLVPRRFRCLPDAAHPRVLPHFTSLRYADPGYAQLRSATARTILEGADDGGEIGAMHSLHQPQREANLRTRLDEYLRFGLRAGIFHAT